jgi:hypothetical protein
MKVTQEDDRIPGKPILIVLGFAVVMIILGSLAAFLIAEWRSAQLADVRGGVMYFEPLPQAAPAAVPGQVPEEVNQIEQVLFADRAPGLEERAFEQKLLGTYGWVDREARLVRIPIDRAIELYVQQSRAPQPGASEVPQ